MKKLFRSVLTKLRSDQKLLDRVKWIGNICTYTAAVAIVISTTLAAAAWPFVLYIIANAFWLAAGIAMKDKPLISLHAFFFVLNAFGIFVRL